MCKHPLHNGGLCPRRDLEICPFHGRIIPRDDSGRPLNEEDRQREQAEQEKGDPHETYGVPEKKPDQSIMDNLWELLENDVTDSTGKPLITVTKRKKKGKEKKKSGLINIRKKPTTSYDRIERQLNSKRTQKMVEEALEYEREAKSRNRKASNWK